MSVTIIIIIITSVSLRKQDDVKRFPLGYSVLHITYFRRHSPGGATVFGRGWCMCSVLSVSSDCCHYLFFIDYRLVVLDTGRVCEFDSPTRLLSDTNSRFYAMAKDAGIITWSRHV